tara:strand:+ start:286 stop:495 length:210 start_codon:yes stop_codon:yes gene_type:complete
MNWSKLIQEILARGYTLRSIATLCGFASPGHLHDLKAGNQETVEYERGAKLVELHRDVMRRVKRAARRQ